MMCTRLGQAQRDQRQGQNASSLVLRINHSVGASADEKTQGAVPAAGTRLAIVAGRICAEEVIAESIDASLSPLPGLCSLFALRLGRNDRDKKTRVCRYGRHFGGWPLIRANIGARGRPRATAAGCASGRRWQERRRLRQRATGAVAFQSYELACCCVDGLRE